MNPIVALCLWAGRVPATLVLLPGSYWSRSGAGLRFQLPEVNTITPSSVASSFDISFYLIRLKFLPHKA